MSFFDQASAIAHRTAECAAYVPEQLALDHVGRDRSAIDGHEWATLASRMLVHLTRDQLLARACLALDEQRGVAGRDALQDRVQAPHFDAAAQDQPEMLILGERHAQWLVAELETEHARPDPHRGRAEQVRITHAHAVDERAIGAAGVDQPKATFARRKLTVHARHGRIAQPKLRAERRTHAQGERAERHARTGVGPFQHQELTSAKIHERGLLDLEQMCRDVGLKIHRRTDGTLCNGPSAVERRHEFVTRRSLLAVLGLQNAHGTGKLRPLRAHLGELSIQIERFRKRAASCRISRGRLECASATHHVAHGRARWKR